MISSSMHLSQLLKLNITGNTVFKDVVPAGYRIKRIDIATTGDRTGKVLSIGTSAGESDVVAEHRLDNARVSYDLTVGLRQFSPGVPQTLYVNDGGGNPWNGMAIDLIITLEMGVDGPGA